ncbi:hypothetical protein VT84_21490 [Gemmata sp. SH-PL17]|uniref:hypothetical protein n=1 Tax=Gemmata sp. SH-PL17 TaxID=1630693 RepID=UPI00078EF616|nr:hypothetical protein [Gemmata sp. SH-PL17]AMV26990.1 hypothetical protein VT84_21490 [Gemmata sp. SH-PL17]
MTEEEWFGSADARRLASFAAMMMSARKLRLFMVAWCRYNWVRVTNPLVRHAAVLAEQFVDGHAHKNQLDMMFDGARSIIAGTLASYLLWTNSAQLGDCVEGFCLNDASLAPPPTDDQDATTARHLVRADIFRDIAGNPFKRAKFDKRWRTQTAMLLARQMYESRDFSAMPILADALQDAGCSNTDVLNHCHGAGLHVRGCWVVDLVLGKS